MEAIKTLSEFKHNLTMGPGYGGYTELIKAVDFSKEELTTLCNYNSDEYQRIRLYDTELVEAILTCWEPQQEGKIHNFENSSGWVKVLSGSISLEHFRIEQDGPVPYLSQDYQVGEVFFLNDNLGYHRFSNKCNERAVVLVIYADKIDRWQVYDHHKGEPVLVKAEVHQNLDLA
jgi:hypothetical protein